MCGVELSVAEADQELEIETRGDDGRFSYAYVPLSVIANMMREAGWDVSPPKSDD